jgi:predicted membrane-bound spermidine synthase
MPASMPSLRPHYDRLVMPFFLPLALIVFTASGFAGLIYESIWSHYLKLFLGHAAYAQTLVLAIFMGGMAFGAWLASRLSPGWGDLLRAYAAIEAVIGVASLAFHEVFVATTAFAFDSVIPSLGSPFAVQAFKWALAALLILPQSVLLGMTFPLMTGAVLRIRPERSGYAIAMLYFANSLGAAVGVLASGFYLIEVAGLPGTLAAAALINLAVAAAAMLLPRPPAAVARPPASAARARAPVPRLRLLLAVAMLTGMSSFMYEIGWIRMLALVLGSSTHAFELMLSAFILGIAFGGLWIRRRIDAAADTTRLLGIVQLVMGLAALATLPIYGSTFHVMRAALGALSLTQNGYVAFNAVSHGIALAVMFPAAFCAGMTLPLITISLLRSGAGEKAIGLVYSANTAGAIVGVLLAVHLGLPLLGVKGLIVAGAAIDLALGVALLAVAGGSALRVPALASAAVSAAAVLVALLAVRLDAHDMASGVYRFGQLLNKDQEKVLLHLDGKTATISITENSEHVSLRTNGKSDGGVQIRGGAPSHDEVTMTLLGALPQFYAPEARRAANIGFGTGLTAHVLLASDRLERVETVEIEPAVVAASSVYLRKANWRALEDPRHRVVFDDAKTHFSSQHARYDVIVSQPSNPWVSGVASLFTTEFYRDVRRYLAEGGLFLQWVQLYEMSPVLLATIVTALQENFPSYEMWMANEGDMIIVARASGAIPPIDPRAFDNPALRAELGKFHIRNLDDLYLHRIGSQAAMAPYFRSFRTPANSDYFPVVDLKAPLARYMRINAFETTSLLAAPVPVLQLLEQGPQRQPDPARLSPGQRPWWKQAEWTQQAAAVRDFLASGDRRFLRALSGELAAELVVLHAALIKCQPLLPPGALRDQLASLARFVSVRLPAEQRSEFWKLLAGTPCQAGLGESERRWLALHAAVASGEAAEMVRRAADLLDNEAELHGDLLAHPLAVYMTASILSGQPGAASQAYSRHRRNLVRGLNVSWQPVFQLLIGHADYGPPRLLPNSAAYSGELPKFGRWRTIFDRRAS